jgi:hypothetical protein
MRECENFFGDFFWVNDIELRYREEKREMEGKINGVIIGSI